MRRLLRLLLCLIALAPLARQAWAAPVNCPRPAAGAVVDRPPDLYSADGVLRVALQYATRQDAQGRTLYCFQTPDGLESPTLHLRPGETLYITLTNTLPQPAGKPGGMGMKLSRACGDTVMNGASVNIHFHGMNIAPVCHGDEVLNTVVNPGQVFRYVVQVPDNEPPGLYWYHPHIHGISAAAVLGGASGAIIVEGLRRVQASVAGLPQRVLVIRDQVVAGVVLHGEPTADLSVNYVPVPFPAYTPAVIPLGFGKRELWRVVNAAADTILDLQLLYDGKAQKLEVVGLDGVPTGSHDGTSAGQPVEVSHILLPPAGRAEFIVQGPSRKVGSATLFTQAIDTGPAGDYDPARTLATIVPPAAAPALAAMGDEAGAGLARPQRFAGLDTATVTATRKLYFSEVPTGPGGGDGQVNFYITVDGATPALFDPANPPAITTRQGAVEDWTIENRSTENHEFHIHQIHFKLLQRDGRPVAAADRQMLDTVQVPYWTGSGPFPSVTVRMDFRGRVVGDFVYHCHLLDHEDGGMMAIIRVLAKAPGSGS